MRYKTLIISGVILLSPLLALANYTITTTATSVQRNGYGYDNTYFALASPFTTTGAGTIHDITIALKKAGSPTDNTHVAIQADNAGNPSNTDLAYVNIDNTTLTTSCADYNGTLDTTLALSASTQYWIVLTRTGSTNTTNYMFDCGATTGGNKSGTVAYSWTALNDGLNRFVALVTESGGGGGTVTLSTTTGNFTYGSTTAQMIGTTAFGLAIIQVLMWLYIIAYVHNTLFKKRKRIE